MLVPISTFVLGVAVGFALSIVYLLRNPEVIVTEYTKAMNRVENTRRFL